MKSIDYLKRMNIEQEVLNHIDSREEVAGTNWIGTPLVYLGLNVERKGLMIGSLCRDKKEETDLDTVEDISLDLLGYAYLLHYRIKELKGK